MHFPEHLDHAALIRALLAMEHPARGGGVEAEFTLERIVNAGHERVFGGARYVQAHFLLAEIYDRRGDGARARPLYTRFLDYWRDGDMDRERIAIAQRKIAQ